jgi:hypothetical protein
VVDRELLTICPHGEDHRGHERGDKTGDARGKRREWRRWTARRMYMDGRWCGAGGTCDSWSMGGEGRAGGRTMMN